MFLKTISAAVVSLFLCVGAVDSRRTVDLPDEIQQTSEAVYLTSYGSAGNAHAESYGSRGQAFPIARAAIRTTVRVAALPGRVLASGHHRRVARRSARRSLYYSYGSVGSHGQVGSHGSAGKTYVAAPAPEPIGCKAGECPKGDAVPAETNAPPVEDTTAIDFHNIGQALLDITFHDVTEVEIEQLQEFLESYRQQAKKVTSCGNPDCQCDNCQCGPACDCESRPFA